MFYPLYERYFHLSYLGTELVFHQFNIKSLSCCQVNLHIFGHHNSVTKQMFLIYMTGNEQIAWNI